MAERSSDGWLRPRIVLPILGVLLLAAVIFSPGGSAAGDVDQRLTTFGTNPFGAKGQYNVLRRLGWAVERRRSVFRAPLDSSDTYLLLDPPIELSATEVSALFDAVRRGATLVVSPEMGSPLADSLGIRRSRYPQHYDVVRSDSGATPHITTPLDAPASAANEFWRTLLPVPTSERDTAPVFPPSTATLVNVSTDSGHTAPAVMRRRLGNGTVLVVADFEFLRNANVRDTTGMILAVRLLEEAGSGPGHQLTFDEYHQGFGASTSLPSVIADALFGTAVGRAGVQVLAACLVLMLVVGMRPILPRDRQSIERRSPLEHVGALTLAYEQVHATRLATNRLVRGVRRRHPLGAGALPDDAYLAMLAQRVRATGADVAVLQRALTHQLPAADWIAVGEAIDHIERAITP